MKYIDGNYMVFESMDTHEYYFGLDTDLGAAATTLIDKDGNHIQRKDLQSISSTPTAEEAAEAWTQFHAIGPFQEHKDILTQFTDAVVEEAIKIIRHELRINCPNPNCNHTLVDKTTLLSLINEFKYKLLYDAYDLGQSILEATVGNVAKVIIGIVQIAVDYYKDRDKIAHHLGLEQVNEASIRKLESASIENIDLPDKWLCESCKVKIYK